MKHFFAYIRVSTTKQGEKGVSLQEQRDAISRYAERNLMTISEWFEERETAAKRGRPIFTQMLSRLKQGKAKGVIIHKIDRSARNLRDWSDLGELIDKGIDVHFANESLDLHSRGGRLSADIQAVIAADFIRNLKEEIRKGFYGRIKQGIYPLGAPIGYLDQGKGKAKIPDPAKAPLVLKVFELYASGTYGLVALVDAAFDLGLRNKNGRKVSMTGLSTMLNNPFYTGLIRLRKTNETFPGIHAPIVPVHLFKVVQQVLRGNTNVRKQQHDFAFRRFLKCKQCGFSLIGECQKGFTYYRCHTCRTCLRETSVIDQIQTRLTPLNATEEEVAHLKDRLTVLRNDGAKERENEKQAISLNLRSIDDRLNRLTDAYLDGTIDKDSFENRKHSLLLDKSQLREREQEINRGSVHVADLLDEYLELVKSPALSSILVAPSVLRNLASEVTSNCTVQGKNVAVELRDPFKEIAKRYESLACALDRDVPRTFHEDIPKVWDALILRLEKLLSKDPNGFGRNDKPAAA